MPALSATRSGSGQRPPATSTGMNQRARSSIPRRAFTAAGLWVPPATPASMPSTARGRGAQSAIIYDSPVTGAKRAISYAELLAEVGALAAVLRDFGVVKGDRVILYMPMVPEAAIAMLACARIGAIHSVVFGGFAAKELATRIDDAKPKVILSASCGIEISRVIPYKPLLDAAIAEARTKP